MGTIDNIYVLNYLVDREISKKKGGVIAFFVDIKAVFDSVNRDILMEAIRSRGIEEGFVCKCGEVLKETRCKIRVGGKMGEEFWTDRGLSQGCLLSPLLFTILLADLEEKMKKACWGEIKIEKKKVYTLAYADDVMLLSVDEDVIKGMIARLEKYLDKELILNVEKSKIMRFRKGGVNEKSEMEMERK